MKRVATLAAALVLAACGKSETPAVAVPGVDAAAKTIRVGLLNDESGPVAAIGRPYAIGKRVLAAEINAGGSGLLPEGWKIELIERDHGYNPQRSVQMFNEVRDQVLFFGHSFGTPNTLPLLPMLARHQVIAYPASLSSKMLENTWTPPLGASYKMQAMRAMDWVVETAGGADKVQAGLIYQQDDYGQDGLEGWTEVAAFHGVTLVAKETYTPGQPDYTAPVTALKNAGATHVFLATVPSATSPILGVAAQLDYKPVWVGNSPAWIDRFYDASVIPNSVFTNFYLSTSLAYWGEEMPLMARFLAAYEKHGKSMGAQDSYILASYLQGMVAVEALRRAIESSDVSRAGYLKALQGLGNYTAEGALPEPFDFSKLPYNAGVMNRILKPDFEKKSWSVVGPYAKPKSLH